MSKTKKTNIFLVFLLFCLLLLSSCGPSTEGLEVTPSAEIAANYQSSERTPTPIEPPPQGPTPSTPGQFLVVTSNKDEDSDSYTLRQALLDAQAGDTIIFDPTVFPPSTPETIIVTSELPHIMTDDLTIDASDAGVILDGHLLTGDWDAGLKIESAEGCKVMGLQIVQFSGPGIVISDGAKNSVIGGDQAIGSGPLGQGNLISNNKHIGIVLLNTSDNTIEGNYIGTDLANNAGPGNDLQGIYIQNSSNNQIMNNLISDNGASGVTLQGVGAQSNIISGNSIERNTNNGIEIREGASHNTVGPDNDIAYNSWSGVTLYSEDSLSNTLTKNSIFLNGWLGIDAWGGANLELPRPIITAFNLSNGIVEGIAYPNAEIETFSTLNDENDEGVIFEGNVKADGTGYFFLDHSRSLIGPQLVITATDSSGNTSEFSLPTFGASGSLNFQHDFSEPKSLLESMQSVDLEDNRIGTWWNSLWGYYPLTELLDEARYMGAKRFRFAINGGEEDMVDWSKPEFSIDPAHDNFISNLAENNIQMTYNLIFWDIETWPGGDGAPCPRFKTEKEILHYLDYVKFAVRHFKDRIQYYEIWNEPDNTACPQWIQPKDYVNLVRRTVPVIRNEYPEAKIQVGSIILSGYTSQSYLFKIIESDIMPDVDVISWHPFYGDSPEHNANYYYDYPFIVQDIKDVAHAHGFTGEFEADEMDWRPYSNPENGQNRKEYGEIAYAKYWMRAILINLGMNVTAGNLRIPHTSSTASFAVRNLATIMPGHTAKTNLDITIDPPGDNIASYTFVLPNGDILFALWTNDAAADHDPGDRMDLYFRGLSADKVVGIDVLYGFEQELGYRNRNGNLVIPNFIVKDYPIIIKFIAPTH